MCMLAKDEKRAKTAKPCAMQRIGEWLASLGLSEYAQRFSENDIDVSVLRHLTDQDLKELARCWRRLPSIPAPLQRHLRPQVPPRRYHGMTANDASSR